MPDIPREIQTLQNDFIWAHYRLNTYRDLYLRNADRISLLDESNHIFFLTIKYVLRDQLIIDASRLTDDYQQGSNKNLSINILPVLAKENNWEFQEDLLAIVKDANTHAIPIKKWRSKKTAHRDLPTSENENLNLQKINIEMIQKIYALIGIALNLTISKLGGDETVWDITSVGGVNLLIADLKKAMICRENRNIRKLIFEELKDSRYSEA